MSVHRIGDEPNGFCVFACYDLENVIAEIEASAHNINQFSTGFIVLHMSIEISFGMIGFDYGVCSSCGSDVDRCGFAWLFGFCPFRHDWLQSPVIKAR